MVGIGLLKVTRLDIRLFLALDLGALVQHEGRATITRRGQAGWLDQVFSALDRTDDHFFQPIERCTSAYSATDRHGRSTFGRPSAEATLPLRMQLRERPFHYAGVLRWWCESLKIGASGGVSVEFRLELIGRNDGVTAPDIVTAYHGVRREADIVFRRVLVALVELWNGIPSTSEMFKLATPSGELGPVIAYDVLDFDFEVAGRSALPKVLYKDGEADALRALAGLSRMSSVMSSYDDASVRHLADLDIGSRSDELWFVNEERLVRHHPDYGKNPYVDAFFTDVQLGAEISAQRAATFVFLMNWLRAKRSEFMLRLAEVDGAIQVFEIMRSLTVRMAEISFVVSDPLRFEETSGHSFFRRIMGRFSETLALEVRRDQIRQSFHDLLELSQTLASQTVAQSAESLQKASISIADSSRKFARNAYLVAILALLLGLGQLLLLRQ